MAFSVVPFALQNASHSAALYRQAISSLVPAGGGLSSPSDLNVTQTGTPSMAVLLGVGRIWIPGTQVANVVGGNFSTQGMYYAENESAITVSVSASNATNPRVDVIYVAVQDSQYSGSNNQVSTTFIATGTPVSGASYPTNAPAIPNNALAVAYVIVRAGSTSVLNSDITNLPLAIVGTTPVTSYTPTLTASTTNPSLGSGATVLGNYSITGTTMTGQFYISFGSSPNAGSGSYQIGLPPGFTYTSMSAYVPIGSFEAVGGGSPASIISGNLRQGGSLSYVNAYWQSAPGTGSVVASNTFAWAAGMNIAGSFTVTIA